MSGRPGVPTWLLAAVVALALGGAGWLFWQDAGGRGDDPAAQSGPDERRERAEGVLTLPDEDDSDEPDDGRRGDIGRDRTEAGRGEADDAPDSTREDESAGEDDQLDAQLPPILEQLRGRRIALAPASAEATGAAVRVGGLRIACSGAASPDALALELEQLRVLEALLRRAGSTVVSTSTEDGTTSCVDERVALLETADLAIVLQVGAPARALAGRTPRQLSGAEAGASGALAADLAGALDLEPPVARPGRDDLRVLTGVGALDLPGGAHVALVVLPADRVEHRERTALAMARALAVAAARLPAPA